MTCKIDEKNVNYLISRCILLENKNSRQAKRIKGFEEYIEVQDERIKELEKNKSIDDKKIILMQSKRINELLEFDQNLNKAGVYRFTKDLEDTIVHLKARIKELEEQIQSMLDNYGN